MASPPTDSLPPAAPVPGRSRADHSRPAFLSSQWRTQIWQRLVVFVMTGASARIQSLAPPAALRFGNWLGNLAYRVAGRQRRRALANLYLAYGEELTLAQRGALTRQVFQHFSRGVVDFLRAPAYSVPELSQMVSCEGWEHFDTALKRGKGVIMVTAHLGNWELLGRWLAKVQSVPLTVVAREPDNPALADYVRSMRENAGYAVLSKGESARGMLRALKRGEMIALLSDQNSGDVFVPFFGVPAGTVAGPASLALHSGAALIPAYCIEKPDHSFHVICFPPIESGEGAAESAETTETRKAEVLRITTRLNEVLESVVRQYPDQWLWLHNRWKSAFEKDRRNTVWPDDTTFDAAQERWKT